MAEAEGGRKEATEQRLEKYVYRARCSVSPAKCLPALVLKAVCMHAHISLSAVARAAGGAGAAGRCFPGQHASRRHEQGEYPDSNCTVPGARAANRAPHLCELQASFVPNQLGARQPTDGSPMQA